MLALGLILVGAVSVLAAQFPGLIGGWTGDDALYAGVIATSVGTVMFADLRRRNTGTRRRPDGGPQ